MQKTIRNVPVWQYFIRKNDISWIMLKIRERLSFVYYLLLKFSLTNRMYAPSLSLIKIDIIVFFPILTLRTPNLEHGAVCFDGATVALTTFFPSFFLFIFHFFWLPHFLTIHFESDWTDVFKLVRFFSMLLLFLKNFFRPFFFLQMSVPFPLVVAVFHFFISISHGYFGLIYGTNILFYFLKNLKSK